MTNHSGFLATTTINGVEVPLKNWTVDPSVRIAESDNSKSGGFILTETAGAKQATFSFQIDYDFDASPFAATPNLIIGQTITNTKLYLNGTSGVFWLFPSATVAGTPMGAEHGGTNMLNVTVQCRSNGTFSYPGGITP